MAYTYLRVFLGGNFMSEKIQSSLLQNTATLLSSLNTGKTSEKDGSSLSELFGGLNIDQLELSDDSRQKIQWAKSQFELNYQVIRSINSSQGTITSQETFSFKGSYEFLQKVSGQDIASGNRNQTDQTKAQNQTSDDALTKLQDYFSPKKTAERILDVATSFFGVSATGQAEGNNEAARRKFADFIGKAIETGFGQAREILGHLPEDVEAGVNETHSLVFSGLENFVKNGVDPEKSTPGGVMDKIAAYRQEAAQQSQILKTSSGSIGYSAKGDLQAPTPDSSTIFTKG